MSSDGDDLPRAHIKRIVKKKLTELMNEGFAGDGKGGKGPDGNVQKEALQAFSECAKIFIHYLTATANDICRDGKRQTISVDDVFKAIDELEFGEFSEPLRQAFEGETKKHPRGRHFAKPHGPPATQEACSFVQFFDRYIFPVQTPRTIVNSADSLMHHISRRFEERRGREVGEEDRRGVEEAQSLGGRSGRSRRRRSRVPR